MKNIILSMVLSMLFFIDLCAQDIQLGIVKSTIYTEGNELYSSSIDGYKKNEFWGIWSMPLGESKTSSHLPYTNGLDYSSKNIEDYDLNTAWLVPDYGIGQYIEFKLDYMPGNDSGAYQFQGICNIFNGYCKSLALWKANSRVKRLKVYFHGTPICYVDLVDTWHFQSFDISDYLPIDKPKNTSNSINCLRFEIVEAYKGIEYKDVGLSEFLCEGSGN